MSLIEVWNKDKTQLSDKHIKQIIAFAGDGNLRDESASSNEFREYLRNITSDMLRVYADQCLTEKFDDSGFALQDIVNEIGYRLGFKVSHGRYRGSKNYSGHDGIWEDEDGTSIVIEVKTTDAYRIDLDTIANYRVLLSENKTLNHDASSMLIVVGRQDTGDLEAQIRGSRHAWEMRLISVEALIRMLNLKEEMGDLSIMKKIHQILVPCEFTRLDKIVEIAFAVVEDIKQEVESEDSQMGTEERSKKFKHVNFYEDCIFRIEKVLKKTMVKQSRAMYASPDGSARILCSISRFYERGNGYWFAFHPHHETFLADGASAYVAFGCGDPKTLFLIPFSDFRSWLENFNKTIKPDSFYWHVIIHVSGKQFFIKGKKGTKPIDISKYFVAD